MSEATRLLDHPPTGDLKDWLYEYDWRYELRSRKATVIETQWVFNDDRTNAIGEREYSVFEGTENQAREYIRLRSNAFRSVRGSSRLGCPAACQSRWKWIDESIAKKIALVSNVKKLEFNLDHEGRRVFSEKSGIPIEFLGHTCEGVKWIYNH